MVYVLGLIVALQLVVGQSLWKLGTERSGFTLSADYLLSSKVWSFVFSPFTIAGLLIYAIATVLYMGMLSKYQYSIVQGVVVPLSLIFAFAIARFFFHERVSLVNVLGLVLLVIGIGLVTKR
jgi:undecaprenyl phosphate-alpha-L-ara4N flippase subunit ArnE